jgi:DNA-binding transcriptional MerR regulator/methylmalonyl-CoA mutase cobalamin-binding subunit
MGNSNRGNSHTIQVVSRRTGLSPDVIRAWERRYGAVEPERSATRRRLYSNGDVRRLSVLRQATLAGRRISDIARLPLDELDAMVREDAAAIAPTRPGGPSESGEAAGYYDRCVSAAVKLDARTLEAQLNRAAMELDVETLFERVLTPLLHEVGERWLAGTASIAHEHLTTSVVRALLDGMRASFTNPSARWHLIATAPAGQHHELGAMKAAVVGAIEGWQATYLGCDLPAKEIATAATELGAHAVALSIVYPERDPLVESELRLLGHLLPSATRLFVGGASASHYAPIVEEIGAAMHSEMKSFRNELRRIAGPAGAEPRENRA